MSNATGDTILSFNGSKKVKETAGTVFNALRARGAFMSDNAPIKVDIAALADFLEGVSVKDITNAADANPDVFAIETDDNGSSSIVTTRIGRVPVPPSPMDAHNLKERLMTPEPKPAPRPRPVREVVRANEGWSTYIGETIVPAEVDELVPDEEFLPTETVAAAPADAVVEPAVEAEQTPIEAEAPAPAEDEPVADAEVPVEASEPAVETPVVEETVEAEAEPMVETEAVVEDVRPEIPVFEERVYTPTPARPLGEPTDFSDVDDAVLAAVLESQFAHDSHIAYFAGRFMTTDRAQRLSRGQIREVREYIEEQEQPLTDEMLVEDVLRVRPNSPDYANSVFAVNYWLSRERDFEFVGTRDQRFWSVSDLPPLGTTLRKPNDIGSDYRFLTDSIDPAAIPHRSVQSVEHVVTFYEWNLGLLPYDADMQNLFPAPMLADQRSAVFTFEIPQTYTTYLVELRYPTPTRGGFFLGLDDLYFDSLVPGAIISISATENDGHYKVEFLAGDEQSDRLLEQDDKRPRYHFRPTSYECVVDPAWLLNEDRFPKLAGEKPMSDRERRKLDTVLETTFERVGMDDGNGGLLASFEDLLAAINIERPVDAALLHSALEHHNAVSGDDTNGYTYDAG